MESLSPKTEATKLIGKFSMNALAELGHKITLDEVKSLAISSALLSVDEIIKACQIKITDKYLELSFINYWQEIKQELENHKKHKP